MSHPEFRIEDSEQAIPLIDETESDEDAALKRNSVPPTSLPVISSLNQNNAENSENIPQHKDLTNSGNLQSPGSLMRSLETSL